MSLLPSRRLGLLYLAVTILLEVAATSCMKLSAMNRKWTWGVVAGYTLCFSVFPKVLQHMPLAIAYAIWSGLGTALTALASVAFFGERLSAVQGVWIGVIVSGVIGLNLAQ